MAKMIRTVAATLLLALACCAASTRAATWMWDQDGNRIDDRIEAVQAHGLTAAHVNGDLAGKLILFVYPETNPLSFGVYVAYDHSPTDDDVARLLATGARLLWRPRYIDYLRAQASYAQVQALAASAGVRRVEAWQVMYPLNDNATRTLRARDGHGGVGTPMFPSVWRDLAITGRGVVVGIIDTGVNDSPDGMYPGHESLRGKFLGGGDFSNPDAALNTSPDSSSNPRNAADAEGSYHATHVAGTAIGSGGPDGIRGAEDPGRYAGMAPDARLVDCKALTDAGLGGGAAEALEWCIAHRDTYWNVTNPDAVYRGVQVVNMSLGGSTNSDGTDADAAAVNAAVRAGIAVCVATGNDGNTHYIPSPCSADLGIAVGALEDANTLAHGDDIVAGYSNEGPRLDDGDTDHADEMKPTVLGSGSDVMSALGDPTTDGTRYHNINGTSMATPTVAGLCALILQANPGLSPLEVRAILQNTAEHRTDHGQQPPSSADSFHVDPNYHPSWGWGEPDAYSAVKEALDNNTTQVVLEGTSSVVTVGGHLEVGLTWATQREVGVRRFDVWRAPDLGGVPGAFSPVSAPDVVPQGHAAIERTANRTVYHWTDTDPSLIPGVPLWYQVRWTDTQGREHGEPAFPVQTDARPVRARVSWSITHNAIDNDITAVFGSGTNPLRPFLVRPAGGSGAADSSRVVVPVGFGSMTQYWFHADLTDEDMAQGYLPPSPANPWFLWALEKGYVNTEGIVDSFSVTTYSGSDATVYRAPHPPTPKVEGQATVFWIPSNPVLTLNHAPVLDPIGGRTVPEGIALGFTVSATSPDSLPLTYAATPLPLGATFNPATRAFTWTPAYGQAGTYAVTFRATDTAAGADSEVVTLTVPTRAPGSNTPPALDPITDRTVRIETNLQIAVVAHDREGGTLTYSATSLPPGASFDTHRQVFSWLPHSGSEGIYRTVFHVADAQGQADSQSVLLKVTPGSAKLPPQGECAPESTQFAGTIGIDVQGLNNVATFHTFTVPPDAQMVQGTLTWTGGPVIDLDLYLVDSSGNVVTSGATATDDPEVATALNLVPGTYRWKVVSFDNPNPTEGYTVTGVVCRRGPTAVGGPRAGLEFALHPGEPNPFRARSLVRFSLPNAAPVQLRVFDVAGRRVRTLVDASLRAGEHQESWDGRSDAGAQMGSGVYFYRLSTPQGVQTRKTMLIR